jgi:hypothetical protein
MRKSRFSERQIAFIPTCGSLLARNRKFADSPLERNGFEIPVPGF